ncbi:hypothetical protein [Fluviispira vulneris]|uniref:hypothetical protein n=1 Tax=Fluviispira vulneris TaxID=2763012 RepID=UPI0016440F10|nr:hypothetical protein [Fluviispira vulneris]
MFNLSSKEAFNIMLASKYVADEIGNHFVINNSSVRSDNEYIDNMAFECFINAYVSLKFREAENAGGWSKKPKVPQPETVKMDVRTSAEHTLTPREAFDLMYIKRKVESVYGDKFWWDGRKIQTSKQWRSPVALKLFLRFPFKFKEVSKTKRAKNTQIIVDNF